MPVILRFSILLCFIIPICASFSGVPKAQVRFIGYGNMPNIAIGKNGDVYVIFSRKDSIFGVYSLNKAKTFSRPSLITVLPSMYSFAMRGPQIAATSHGLVITAITQAGNIYSLTSPDGHSWSKPTKVNDTDSSAPEGLMSITADRNNVFAVWLDIRGNRRNKIYGSSSVNGGVSWLPNKLIYQSPDSTVCECCKPSVVMRGDRVYVMFRNWFEHNRDLYLMNSTDGGKSFSSAAKLGTGSWKLNGCPMDGGGIDMNSKGGVQTVWRRESKIYTATPGKPESEIGEGKSCVMVSLQNENIYAWVHKGDIVIRRSDGQLIKPGKGANPVLKKLDPHTVICVWENENQIETAVFAL